MKPPTVILLIALLLPACKSPDEGTQFGPWPGMPIGGGAPEKPKETPPTRFYELPSGEVGISYGERSAG